MTAPFSSACCISIVRPADNRSVNWMLPILLCLQVGHRQTNCRTSLVQRKWCMHVERGAGARCMRLLFRSANTCAATADASSDVTNLCWPRPCNQEHTSNLRQLMQAAHVQGEPRLCALVTNARCRLSQAVVLAVLISLIHCPSICQLRSAAGMLQRICRFALCAAATGCFWALVWQTRLLLTRVCMIGSCASDVFIV